MLRRLVSGRATCIGARSSPIGDNLILSSVAAASYSTVILAEDRTHSLLASAITPRAASGFQPFILNHSRSFSSPPSSGNFLSLSLSHVITFIYLIDF